MTEENLNTQHEADGSESRFNRITPPVSPKNIFEQTDDECWHTLPLEAAEPEYAVQTPVELPSRDQPTQSQVQRPKRKKHILGWLAFAAVLLAIFFTPARTTILILGVDWRPADNPWLGRSDTMILTTLPPVLPQVSMLSIPRDLWVTIPNHYDNRINTAHYFAELENPGSGTQAAIETVEYNFGINVDYAVRIKFAGFVELVDALGGITVDLPSDMSGMTAGKHHLDGTEALKFVRDRSGSDDFFRQQRAQLFISAAFKEVLNPLKWPRLPAVIIAATKAIDTDLPFWLWPRMAYGFVFSAVNGFDAQTIDRNYVTPWVTDDGAQVLLPNWDQINPMIDGLFK